MSSSSSSPVDPQTSESAEANDSTAGAVSAVDVNAVAVTSEFTVGDGAPEAEKNRIPDNDAGSAAAAIEAAAGNAESAPPPEAKARPELEDLDVSAELDTSSESDAEDLLLEETPLEATDGEAVTHATAEATAAPETPGAVEDAGSLVIEAALAEDPAFVGSFGAGAAVQTSDAEGVVAHHIDDSGVEPEAEVVEAASDDLLAGPPDLVVPAAPEEADFLRRVVLPPPAHESIFTSATKSHTTPLPSRAGSLPVGLPLEEDESGDRTVISDPPSAELLAAMAISPAPKAPLSGWQEKPRKRVQLSPLQLGGLLVVTALGAGLLGRLGSGSSAPVAASAPAAVAAPAAQVPKPEALTITPLPAPAAKPPETPADPAHAVKAPAEPPAHTGPAKHPGAHHSKRVARREWVDPFEK